MGAAACLSIDTLNIDDSELVAWDNTSLIERESILTLRLSLVHEAFSDVVSSIDETIRSILNLLLLIPRQTLEVCDIQMGLYLGLLGTCLPDVRSEHLPARGEDDVRSSVMCLQLHASLDVNGSACRLSDHVHTLRELLVELMKDTLANLDAVDHVVYYIDAIDSHRADVIGLAS